MKELTMTNLLNYNSDMGVISNSTRTYILPAFLAYGNVFMKKLGNFRFVAVGVADMDFPELFDDTCIGFLVDARKSRSKDFKSLSPAYVTDYPFGELLYGSLHMIVLKLPPIHQTKVVANFKKSNYSKMYDNPADLFESNFNGKYFRSIKERCLRVCTKDVKLKQKMEEMLSLPRSIITIPETAELDTKIILAEEYFNHKK